MGKHLGTAALAITSMEDGSKDSRWGVNGIFLGLRTKSGVLTQYFAAERA